MTVCTICGRELTDPASVASGIGPECRIKHKNDEAGQSDMFSLRCRYSYFFRESVLILHDMGAGKSIANDIRNVLQEIMEAEGDINQYRIMYRDSYGLYDGIKQKDGKFVSFFYVGGEDTNVAIKKLLKMKL